MSDDNEPASRLNEFLDEWKGKKPDEDNKELLAKVAEQGEQIKELLDKDSTRDKEAAYKEDIKPVIATVKGEEKASDFTVSNWLDGEANKNPKLSAIFENREKNPEAFDKMIGDLTPKFKEYIQAESKKVLGVKDDDTKDNKDEGKTDDTKDDANPDKDLVALAHAYRIARNTNAVATDDYEKVEWSGLSDSAFAQMSEKVFADMRSGKLKPEKAA